MKIDLNFEDVETKKLLSKLNFEFFLKQNFEVEKYNNIKIKEIYDSYNLTNKHLKVKSKEIRKQFNYFLKEKSEKCLQVDFYKQFLN